MKQLIIFLMAISLLACEDDSDINIKNIKLSDVTIECINETIVNNSTSSFTRHTYLCRGFIDGFRGDCNIRITHNNNKVCNDHVLTVAGKEIPFEFTFTPEEQHFDNPNNNFWVHVYDNDSTLLCKTTVVERQRKQVRNSLFPADFPCQSHHLCQTGTHDKALPGHPAA